jgi:hypothetical protein
LAKRVNLRLNNVRVDSRNELNAGDYFADEILIVGQEKVGFCAGRAGEMNDCRFVGARISKRRGSLGQAIPARR